VAAAEALVVGDHRALRRPDVGDDAVRPGRGEHVADERGQRADRRRDDGDLRPVDRLGERRRGGRDRSALLGERQRIGGAIPADDLGVEPARCGEPDGPADQPDADDRDADGTRLLRPRR
jgi:hypothetical protein